MAEAPHLVTHTEAAAKELAAGGGVSVIANGIGQLVKLIFQVLLSRVLGVAGYGYFSLGRSILEISLRFALLGLHNAVVRFIPIYSERNDAEDLKYFIATSTLLVIASSLAIASTLWMSAIWLAHSVFEEPYMVTVLRVFALTVPALALLTFFAFCTRGLKNMRYYSGMLEIVHPILLLFIIATLFSLGWKLEGALWGFFLATVCCLLFMYLLIRRTYPGFIDFGQSAQDKSLPRLPADVISFALSSFFLGFSQILLVHTDRLMLGALTTGSEVGMYVAAALIAQKITFFQGAFNGIFAPIVAGLYHQNSDNDAISSLFKAVTKWTQMLTIPVLMIFLGLGDRILAIFGTGFSQAGEVLVVMAVGQFINISVGPVGYMLVMTGRQNIELLNSLLMGTINIALNLWLIPKHGVLGAAAATACSIVIINILRLFQVSRYMSCHPFSSTMLAPIFSFLLIFGVWRYLQLNFDLGLMHDLIAAAGALITYSAICLLLFSRAKDDAIKMALRKYLSKIFRSS